MFTKHVRTADDLIRFGCALRIECGDCGKARTLDGFELAKACGTGLPLGDAGTAEMLSVWCQGGAHDDAVAAWAAVVKVVVRSA